MSAAIACIGECMLELSGAEGDLWRMGFAGDTFNTAWYLRALLGEDHDVAYVSAFGDDPFSQRQRAFMADAGIGTAASPVIAGASPGLYAITLAGAERSFTYWRSSAAARRLADDPDALRRSLAGRSLVYVSGITLAILEPPARATLLSALGDARMAGAMIAFDPNFRARLWPDPGAARDAFGAIIALADTCLPTYPDEAALFGDASPEATADRMAAAGVSEIVVKDGANAALVRAGGEQASVPALAVDAVDTTGAGDSFNGGYLAARLAGQSPVEAVRFAHRVAAEVVQVRGALAPASRFAPMRDELARRLAKGPSPL